MSNFTQDKGKCRTRGCSGRKIAVGERGWSYGRCSECYHKILDHNRIYAEQDRRNRGIPVMNRRNL